MDKKEDKKTYSILSCGIEFVSAIVVSVFIGVYLDEYFETAPWLLIAFFILGCVSGYLNIMRHISNSDSNNQSDLD